MKCACCRRKAEPGRTVCTRHKHQLWAAANPLAYAFGNAKRRARQRGKDFTLTPAEYLAAFQAAGVWLDPSKPKPTGWELDRINVLKGYVPGNVQVIQAHVHKIKTYTERGMEWFCPMHRMRPVEPTADPLPF